MVRSAAFGMAMALATGPCGSAFGQAATTPFAEPSPAAAPPAGSLSLKRRIAICRFSNATLYGRALLLPGEKDPLADQAADMLSARLVESGKFIVLERRDMDAIRKEQSLVGQGSAVGADTILVGSVTQFGRKAEGKVGFLNAQARQVATATVEIRLVDTRTGQAFFSTSGSGSATVATSEVAGFGSSASYDSTLNDKAIAAAVSDLMTNVMEKLQERAWSTDILTVRGTEVMISGGAREGLRVGNRLMVARRGQVIVSRQTGLPIELPSEPIGTIEITGFFGSGDTEGARANLVSGQVGPSTNDLIVTSPAT